MAATGVGARGQFEINNAARQNNVSRVSLHLSPLFPVVLRVESGSQARISPAVRALNFTLFLPLAPLPLCSSAPARRTYKTELASLPWLRGYFHSRNLPFENRNSSLFSQNISTRRSSRCPNGGIHQTWILDSVESLEIRARLRG